MTNPEIKPSHSRTWRLVLAVALVLAATGLLISTTTSPTPPSTHTISTRAFCNAVDGYYLLGLGAAQGTHAEQVHTIVAQSKFLTTMAENTNLPRFKADLLLASRDGYILAKDNRALADFRVQNYNYQDNTTLNYNSAVSLAISIYGPVIIMKCHTLPLATTTTATGQPLAAP